MPHPLAYFLTWSTYGTHLRGDGRGWAARNSSASTPPRPPNPHLTAADADRMRDEPVTLSPRAQALVAGVIAEVCEHRRWPLHAVNPRTQHVHVVLSSPGEPERALNDLKAWCTRRLREARLVGVGAVWTKHGSTRYINDADSFARAVWYVIEEQD